MLKGIDPRLNADLLRALRAMGHGDVVVLCDTNFPADAVARSTALGRPLTMENVGLAQAAEAVLSVLPLDTFTDDVAIHMAVVDDPDAVPPPIEEVAAAMRAAGEDRPVTAIERFAFYDLARAAYAVVLTGERRPYGNVAFRKGIVPPDA